MGMGVLHSVKLCHRALGGCGWEWRAPLSCLERIGSNGGLAIRWERKGSHERGGHR